MYPRRKAARQLFGTHPLKAVVFVGEHDRRIDRSLNREDRDLDVWLRTGYGRRNWFTRQHEPRLLLKLALRRVLRMLAGLAASAGRCPCPVPLELHTEVASV